MRSRRTCDSARSDAAGRRLIQHGQELRRYTDSNNDGKADEHEVVLEGFGIQDSHLFPHQFERAPGGWVYLAQGAFNYSTVQRPGKSKFEDGSDAVIFNNCKLGRFKLDGSAFESLTGGPNNIWGLVISRSGETFVQEANDLGYPVAEFSPGNHYPTGFGPKMRTDAPVLPRSTASPVMGGTGLSGLALAEDQNSPFAEGFDGAQVFYVVNPITSKIQIVTLTRDDTGHPVFKNRKISCSLLILGFARSPRTSARMAASTLSIGATRSFRTTRCRELTRTATNLVAASGG